MKKRLQTGIYSVVKVVVLNNFFLLVLLFLTISICVLNYRSGTYLTGWDTLQPELNFGLSFERLLSGAFRSEQGLGAVTAHSHISDLPRVILLFLSSFFLPNHFLRYFYISTGLVVGVVGCYLFIKRAILEHLPDKISSPIAFSGAIFYLFNLGTLQHFSVPFEMFVTQYALLPYLLLTAVNYLKSNTRRNLAFFGLITLLSAPMAYASALWFAYFLSLISFLFIYAFKKIKLVLILILVTLVINFFWLGPSMYFILSGNASFVPEAKINKIFSDEAFNYNKSYGSFTDILIFKSYLIEWPVYQGEGKFGYLLDSTRKHISNPWVLSIGYIASGVVILGFLFSFKNPVGRLLILPSLICLVFIINQNPPFDYIFSLIRDSTPIVKEALRAPFTKFSIILMFTFACFFSLGNLVIYRFFQKITSKNLNYGILLTQTLIFFSVLIIYMWPFFKGQLISPYMQVRIPQEYFELFSYLDKQPVDARVAVLPVHSFWGWIYYDWGYQGAQFISFGIKQPVLDRDYDRWSTTSEQYYREMSYAIYSQNISLLENVLEKYKIKYLVVDQNVIAPSPEQDKKVLFYDEIKSLLSSSSKLQLTKQFNNEILVYEVNLKQPSKNFISSPKTLVSLSSKSGPFDIDWAYSDYSDYIYSPDDMKKSKLLTDIPEINYPFRSLVDNQAIVNNNLISLKDNDLSLSMRNLKSDASLSLNNYLDNEKVIPADVYVKKGEKGVDVKLELKLFQLNSQSEKTNLTFTLDYLSPLSDKENFLLNIDQLQTVRIKELKEEYIYNSSIFLSRSTYNNIALYQQDNTLTTSTILSQSILEKLIYSEGVGICSSPSEGQLVGANAEVGNSLKIISQNAQACFKLPISKVIDRDSVNTFKTLLNIDFTVEGDNQNFGHFCLWDRTINRCIKEQSHIYPGTQIREFFPISSDDIDRLDVIFYLDNPNYKEEQISYSNIKFSTFIPISLYTVSPDDIRNNLSNQNLIINPNTKLVISYPKSSNLTELTVPLQQGQNLRSCGNLLPSRFESRYDQKGKFIEYTSQRGSICDYFSLPTLSHSSGYLVSIKSQNISGLPLRVCVANNFSKRCDLYLSFPISKDFSDHILLIPPTSDGGAGYDIHLDNSSVGNIATINRIKEIRILPFPYQGITRLNFKSEESAPLLSELKIDKVKQILPHIFMANYSNQKSTPSVLVLNQSFDYGWVMLGGGSHVWVNGWANGWIIEGKKTSQGIIFYLPDFLEGLGILLILVFFSYLLGKNTYLKTLLMSGKYRS